MSILKSRKIECKSGNEDQRQLLTEIRDPLSLKKDELGYIINHVFMPPKLPQEHDPEPAKKDSALLKAIDQAARSFCEVVSTIDTSKNTKDTWITLQRMVSTMMHLHLHGSFSRAQLQTALNQMDVNGEHSPCKPLACLHN
ncbi:hypothetical protein FRC15_006645 [Serendipita sp. 397]|nr:hypothetical protein FRC15_006645 [Serendipita sp. 397]